MQPPSSSLLHLCHKTNSSVDSPKSRSPVPPPQLPSGTVSSSYTTCCASCLSLSLSLHLQPVLLSEKINSFKPFACLGVRFQVHNTVLQIVTGLSSFNGKSELMRKWAYFSLSFFFMSSIIPPDILFEMMMKLTTKQGTLESVATL